MSREEAAILAQRLKEEAATLREGITDWCKLNGVILVQARGARLQFDDGYFTIRRIKMPEPSRHSRLIQMLWVNTKGQQEHPTLIADWSLEICRRFKAHEAEIWEAITAWLKERLDADEVIGVPE